MSANKGDKIFVGLIHFLAVACLALGIWLAWVGAPSWIFSITGTMGVVFAWAAGNLFNDLNQ